MTDSEYENVSRAIDACDKVIRKVAEEFRTEAILRIVFSSIIIVIIILSAFVSNIQGFLTTLGSGCLGFAAQYQSWKDAVISYFLDPKRLHTNIEILRAQLETCSKDDKQCLDSILELVRCFLNELRNRATASQSK
jgi:hypothetical protein